MAPYSPRHATSPSPPPPYRTYAASPYEQSSMHSHGGNNTANSNRYHPRPQGPTRHRSRHQRPRSLSSSSSSPSFSRSPSRSRSHHDRHADSHSRRSRQHPDRRHPHQHELSESSMLSSLIKIAAGLFCIWAMHQSTKHHQAAYEARRTRREEEDRAAREEAERRAQYERWREGMEQGKDRQTLGWDERWEGDSDRDRIRGEGGRVRPAGYISHQPHVWGGESEVAGSEASRRRRRSRSRRRDV